jgi:eukaryotic-like serine/threonine-protein kinase
LAKAYHKEWTPNDTANAPTLTEQVSIPGMILGTAAYMSPEQAKGKTVDKRTDIWAFGCVMYECLTAKRPFQGDTITETVASILKNEPDWTLLPVGTSSVVRSLLWRCLQKDPDRRLHDIADARIEMGESFVLPTEIDASPRRTSFSWLASGSAVLILVGILIGIGAMKYTGSTLTHGAVRSVIKIEPGLWLVGMRWPDVLERPTHTAMVVSRDNRFLVYCAIAENPGSQAKSRLYLRPTDQVESKPIPGTEGGIGPFLSPDNRWLGYWADGKLMKVPLEGGVPRILCDAPEFFGASWGGDEKIVLSFREDAGLYAVSADSGNVEGLTVPDKTKEESSHRFPCYLPDGRNVLFTVMRTAWDMQPRTAVLNLATRQWRYLLEDGADARYVPTGHLVFLRQGTLMAVLFDLDSLQVTGRPVPIIDNVMQLLNQRENALPIGAGQLNISDSGWLVYALGGIFPDEENSLVWVDQKGAGQPIAPFKAHFFSARLSPDGQKIVYTTVGHERGLWIYDLNRGTAMRLTSGGKTSFAVWSRDGRQVIFNWSRFGPCSLYYVPIDGSSPMEPLTSAEYEQRPGSISPDGTLLAFTEDRPVTQQDILLLDLRNLRVTPYHSTPANESFPDFSPDGRWLAYASDESGRSEVYVRSFPGPGGKFQISHEGGSVVFWSRDGKQLFYRGGNLKGTQMWSVDIRTDGVFSAGKPRLLFQQQEYVGYIPVRGCDLSSDGQQFLMVKQQDLKPQPVTEMILVQNWFEELKRLVPAGK